MRSRPWTSQEVQALAERYAEEGSTLLATDLARTSSAVRQKAIQLELVVAPSALLQMRRRRVAGLTHSQRPMAERFWEKVAPPDEEGCRYWTAGSAPNLDVEYGRFYVPNLGARAAHRVAFFLTHGYWAEQVNHTCDHGLCVAPNHLYAGTQRQNVDDMIERGRLAVGEAHGRARLTEEAVRQIRKTLGHETLGHIARQFGVGVSTVQDINKGRTWTHVLTESA